MIGEVEERVTLINGDLIEPLTMYIQHNSSAIDNDFDQLEFYGSRLHKNQESIKKAKEEYIILGYQQEKDEIAIEKALLNNQGPGSKDDIQDIMDESVTTKYKAQIAEKAYKDSVETYNKQLDQI